MKRKLLIVALVCGSFMSGVSLADSPPSEKMRASVTTSIVDSKVNITITPEQGYKWNGLYPATLKFSVCSDMECVMYTEKIVVKK